MSTAPTLTLQRATVDDWPGIWPLFREVVRAGDTYTYPVDLTSEAARPTWIADRPRDEAWAARDPDGTVVGTYHVSPNQGGHGDHVANGSYMVRRGRRGTGIGEQLVRHSLRRAAELGFVGMQFNAVVATNTGAVALYERLGFAVVGRVPGAFRHPAAGRVDLVV